MPAVTEQQDSRTDFHFWIKILVAVNCVFRIIAAIVVGCLLQGGITDRSKSSGSLPLIAMVAGLLAPLLLLLVIIHSSWKEQRIVLKIFMVLAIIAAVGSILVSILGFVKMNKLGTTDSVIYLIHAPLIGSLAYALRGRIQEIDHKIRSYPMGNTQTCGSAA